MNTPPSSTVLITGANRGIGLGLTEEFLQKGWQVFATARSLEKAKALQKLEASFPQQLHLETLNICDDLSCFHLTEKLKEQGICLDVLINNAAIFPEEGDEKLEELPLKFFSEAFETNVVGTVRITQSLLPYLRQSSQGKIINISSGAGSIASKDDPRHACYSTSKAALNMLTRCWAHEFRTEGIIVISISPGWVKTEMGGENALISVQESSSALFQTITHLSMEKTGCFLGRNGDSSQYYW